MANTRKLTVRQMMETVRKSERDVDFIDSYDERAWCAYCGTELTEEGEKHFKRALNLPIERVGESIVVVGAKNGTEANALKELLVSMAGYCPASQYNKWFK